MAGRKISYRRLLCYLPILAGFIWPSTALAAQSTTGGISVAPSQLQFSLPGSSGSQQQDISIVNNYPVSINLSAQFKGIDEASGSLVPAMTLDKTLANSLSVSQTIFTIPAHGSQQLTVQVTNSAALAPGGHYATLVLTQAAAPGQTLSVQAALAISLFIIKTDGATLSFELTDVKSNGFLFRLPDQIGLTFRNTGNTHIVPRAVISLTANNATRLYAKGVANQNSVPIFPGQTWQENVTLRQLGHTWLPQRLQLAVTYRADGTDNPQTMFKSVWYIPPLYPLLLVLLCVGGLAIKFWHRRKRLGKHYRLKPR